METIDPKDQSNQNATDQLLEKSRELKERTKATSEKLGELLEKADQHKSVQEPNK
jgi:hypothetical protein